MNNNLWLKFWHDFKYQFLFLLLLSLLMIYSTSKKELTTKTEIKQIDYLICSLDSIPNWAFPYVMCARAMQKNAKFWTPDTMLKKRKIPYVKFELNPITGRPSIFYIHLKDGTDNFNKIDTLLLIQGFEKGYEFQLIFRDSTRGK